MSSPHSLSRKNLQRSVHAALRAWHSPGGTPESLLDSLLIVQERRNSIGDHTNPSLLRLATSRILLEAIDNLEQHDQKGARVLRLRFPDDNTLMMVAHKLNVSEHTVSRLQREAIEQLGDILLSQEMAFREQKAQSIEAGLPPASYTRLIGLEEARSLLLGKLIHAGSPWVTAIVGIGGIGKTALADSVVRQGLREFWFDQIIWLAADPQTMSGRSHSSQHSYEVLIADLADHLWPGSADLAPAKRIERVRMELKSRQLLIVIDNLESESDTAYLMAHLNDLAKPSKFLLTSRTRPAPEATVFSYSLGELSLADATALLIHHARELGLEELAEVTAAETEEIYAITGGNPLALKLVISLLDVMPLTDIHAGLARSRQGPIEELYKHIYWKSWLALSDNARNLLLAMSLVARSGARAEQLQEITGLFDAEFWLAVQELRKRSLLEVRGNIHERRFGIHRLTETFLHTELLQEQDEAE